MSRKSSTLKLPRLRTKDELLKVRRRGSRSTQATMRTWQPATPGHPFTHASRGCARPSHARASRQASLPSHPPPASRAQTNPEVFGKLLLGDDISSARSNAPAGGGRLPAATGARGAAASTSGGKMSPAAPTMNRSASIGPGKPTGSALRPLSAEPGRRGRWAQARTPHPCWNLLRSMQAL
jgi:hypothetical protein